LVMGRGGFHITLGPQYPRHGTIIMPSFRTLTYEAELTLDLPRHGAARALPWLSTELVVGPFAEGGGD